MKFKESIAYGLYLLSLLLFVINGFLLIARFHTHQSFDFAFGVSLLPIDISLMYMLLQGRFFKRRSRLSHGQAIVKLSKQSMIFKAYAYGITLFMFLITLIAFGLSFGAIGE